MELDFGIDKHMSVEGFYDLLLVMIYNYGFVIANDPFLWTAVSNIGYKVFWKEMHSFHFQISSHCEGDLSKVILIVFTSPN